MAIFCCRSQRDLRFRFAVHLRPKPSGPSRPLFLFPPFLTSLCSEPLEEKCSDGKFGSMLCTYSRASFPLCDSTPARISLTSRMRTLYFFRRPQVPFTYGMIQVGNDNDYTTPSVSVRPSVSSFSIFRWREIGNSVGGMMGQRGLSRGSFVMPVSACLSVRVFGAKRMVRCTT